MAKTTKKATSRAKATPTKSAPAPKTKSAKAIEKKPAAGMQRVLTAEGWKRLMMGSMKKGKK